MTPARFRWGMILIQIGILILLQNNNVISDLAWENLLMLFPIVLIAVGIEKIFTKSKLQFISYLTTIGLFFGGFAIAFSSSGIGFDNDNFLTDSIYQEEVNPDVKVIKASLNLDENDITIRDSGPELILAEFNEYSRKPKIESYIEDSIAHIKMQAQDHTYFGGAIRIDNNSSTEWNIQFSEDLPLDLDCSGFDNDFHLNFLTSRLQKLSLDTESSSIYLKIGPNEAFVEINIMGEDSKLRLRVPEKIGVKILGNDAIFYKKLGFEVTEDGTFINENYNTAEQKIDLEIGDRLLSFSLDYY